VLLRRALRDELTSFFGPDRAARERDDLLAAAGDLVEEVIGRGEAAEKEGRDRDGSGDGN
jgi:hypothetical protein